MTEIFKVFLKIGCLGFGGPIATIALMEQEAQHRRKWLTKDMFHQAYTLCKILPGPAAAQMAIYLGSLRQGFWGGLLAGLLFILPGSLIALLLTYLYFHFGTLLSFEKIFYGIGPIVIAIIADSVLRMSHPYRKNLKALLIIFLSFGLSFGWMHYWSSYELPLIFLCGIISLLWEILRSQLRMTHSKFYDLSPLILLTLLCLKAGTLMFGGGFAIIPLLEHHLVTVHSWMSHKEFLDGLTIGLITPGPFMTSVVFYGYKIKGFLGAFSALSAVFLPSFLFIFIAIPFMKKFKNLKFIRWFVDGAIASIIGGIVAMLMPLATSSLKDFVTISFFAIGFLLLLSQKIPSWALILSGGILGLGYQTFLKF